MIAACPPSPSAATRPGPTRSAHAGEATTPNCAYSDRIWVVAVDCDSPSASPAAMS